MSVATQQPVAAPVGTPASADKPNRLLGLLELPSVGALFLWMIVPLALTIYFSFIRYSLLNPDISGFAGFENYQYLVEDEAFWPSIINTVILVGSVLIITIVFGTLSGSPLRPRIFWQECGDLVGDRSIFCHADGERIDLEEFHPASGLRTNRLRSAKVWAPPNRLVYRLSPAFRLLLSSPGSGFPLLF